MTVGVGGAAGRAEHDAPTGRSSGGAGSGSRPGLLRSPSKLSPGYPSATSRDSQATPENREHLQYA
jgi:hypothetical protein